LFGSLGALLLAAWPIPVLAEAIPAPERRTPIVTAAERAGPSVVNISAERLVQRRTSAFDDFFRSGPREGARTESLGSGVVIEASGIVVTNDHVVSGASRIFVTTPDGRELEADVLGADAENDLAVLKVEGKGLKAIRLGSASDLMIGETVVAIGNPFGLSSSVTSGILSAVHRPVRGEGGRTYSDFLQTDAAINPGNSGGALVNVLGELIGINTAIVGGANTIGFAIPVDRVKRIADDLLRFGEVKPVWTGLRGTTLSSDRKRASARNLGLSVKTVYPGSPAEKAGILRGDLIVSAGGTPVESREAFDTLLISTGPDRELKVDLKRGARDVVVSLRTSRAPENLGTEVLRREIGLSVTRGKKALVVASVTRDSSAERKGIQRGDAIVAVNGMQVDSLADLNRAMERGLSRSSVALVVARGGYGYTLSFALD
jgi:serine protease Do